MIRSRLGERALWALGLALTAIGGWSWSPSGTNAHEPAEGLATGSATGRQVTADRADLIIARNPFRTDRRPAARRFGSEGPSTATAPAPPFQLAGILGGPPWQAVLEGLPGADGSTIVREGDSIGAWRVLRIEQRSLVVAGPDSTWVVPLPEHRP
jgi:hypothetical protein